MRVALVHSFYSASTPSGENVVVLDELEVLRGAGIDVHLVRRDADELRQRAGYSIGAAYRVGSGRGYSPLPELEAIRPDVVHVHNLFPNYGTRWLRDCRFPVVHTLHNFRPLCAAGTLYRDGKQCTDCPDTTALSAIRHACFRSSRAQTIPVAFSTRRGLVGNPVFQRARTLITLTEDSRQIYERYGADPKRLVVKPNFVPDNVAPRPTQHTDRDGWLYVGILTAPKGVLELVQRWPGERVLTIVGDGPLRGPIERLNAPGVSLVGNQARSRVLEMMAKARGLVFPSRWLEAFPMVYAEALASGLPILAFDGNAVATDVRLHRTGVVVRWEDNLDEALAAAETSFRSLSQHCRLTFEHHFAQRAHLASMDRIYRDAIEQIDPSHLT